MKIIYYLLSGLIIIAMSTTKFPQTEITNGLIRATIYLPDAKTGYYQGTRFDWSGNMVSLEYSGHNISGSGLLNTALRYTMLSWDLLKNLPHWTIPK